jgi:uncharacterized protein
MVYPVLTKKEALIISKAKDKAEVSLDLGISKTTIIIDGATFIVNDKKILLNELDKVKEDTIYVIDDDCTIKQVSFFSEDTNIYYKLFPTKGWPTVKLSSVPMHRHIKVDPKQDTLSKIKEVWPVRGKVLDTCCGLGYTAIMASKNAEIVYTFERDANVQRIAEYNPYSRELFSDKRIIVKLQDVSIAIKELGNDFFDRIIHDPPTFKISPELYNLNFYKEIFRVLKRGGILYHYAPNPGKTKGGQFYIGIIKKLQQAGFRKAEYHPQSSGIRAEK